MAGFAVITPTVNKWSYGPLLTIGRGPPGTPCSYKISFVIFGAGTVPDYIWLKLTTLFWLTTTPHPEIGRIDRPKWLPYLRKRSHIHLLKSHHLLLSVPSFFGGGWSQVRSKIRGGGPPSNPHPPGWWLQPHDLRFLRCRFLLALWTPPFRCSGKDRNSGFFGGKVHPRKRKECPLKRDNFQGKGLFSNRNFFRGHVSFGGSFFSFCFPNLEGD